MRVVELVVINAEVQLANYPTSAFTRCNEYKRKAFTEVGLCDRNSSREEVGGMIEISLTSPYLQDGVGALLKC